METLFISDVHLAEQRPEKTELLIELLRGPATRAAAFYILGDLFDSFWLGDDDKTPPAPQIINELRTLTDSGVDVYFIRGNREFMLGEGFEELTGCKVLDDYHIAVLGEEKLLLMHGDRLCIDDTSYQNYRRFVQHPFIQKLFLVLPYRVRHFLVRGLQPLMRNSADNKPAEIVDVAQTEVLRTMEEYGVKKLIHGHTHRPGVHSFDLNGQSALRIVLNDWYEEDSVLVWNNGSHQLMGVQNYINLSTRCANRIKSLTPKPLTK